MDFWEAASQILGADQSQHSVQFYLSRYTSTSVLDRRERDGDTNVTHCLARKELPEACNQREDGVAIGAEVVFLEVEDSDGKEHVGARVAVRNSGGGVWTRDHYRQAE
jgi:hypothetical protein